MIIALDGPSAAGKGTLARGLARYFNLSYLDTGLLYRATAYKILKAGDMPEEEAAAFKAAKELSVKDLEDPCLRQDEVATAASLVSTFPSVRAELLAFQRHFAKNPPAEKAGAILDGRDIGTVVCPDATLKFFVTAPLEVRAERRFKELKEKGLNVPFEKVLADMQARDERDRTRATAPLLPAKEAHLFDTGQLTIEEALKEAIKIIEAHLIAQKI